MVIDVGLHGHHGDLRRHRAILPGLLFPTSEGVERRQHPGWDGRDGIPDGVEHRWGARDVEVQYLLGHPGPGHSGSAGGPGHLLSPELPETLELCQVGRVITLAYAS